METKSEDQKQSQARFDDEIDLLELLAKVIRIVRKRILLLPIFLILGIGLGISGYFAFKPTFQTKMIASSTVINYPAIAGIINTLNDLVKEANYEELSSRLKLTSDDIKSIKEISCENIIGEEIEEINNVRSKRVDEYSEQEQFIINVKLTNTRIISTLQKSVVDYIENNPYIKNKIKIEKEIIQRELENIDNDLKYNDSIRLMVIAKMRSGENQNIKIDLGDFDTQQVELYERQSTLQKELELLKNIQIIEPFTKFQKPTSFDIPKSIVAGVTGGLFLWIMTLMLLELNKAVKKVELSEDD